MTTNSYTQNQSDLLHAQGQDTILKIAYSNSSFAPPNTLEHFLTMAKLGFNALKGDVTITAPPAEGSTSTSRLVMCHDDFYTKTSGGKITSAVKNSSMNTDIISLQMDAVKQLEFDSTYLGHPVHPCEFEDYIKVCVDFDVIPYITIRNTEIDTVVAPEIISVLEKYNLINKAIIACYKDDFNTGAASIEKVRALNQDVMTCIVMKEKDALTTADVDRAVNIGNCAISFFMDGKSGGSSFDSSKAAIDYAISKGVRIFNAIVYSYSRYINCIRNKISGAQIGKPFFPIKRTTYPIRVSYTKNTVRSISENTYEIKIDDENSVNVKKDKVFLLTKGVGNTNQEAIEIGDTVVYYSFKEYGAGFSVFPKVKIEPGSNGTLKISMNDFALEGSDRGFGDGLLDLWIRFFPYDLNVYIKNDEKTSLPYTLRKVSTNYSKYTLEIDAPDVESGDICAIFDI